MLGTRLVAEILEMHKIEFFTQGAQSQLGERDN